MALIASGCAGRTMVFDFNWAGPPDLHTETVRAAVAYHAAHGADYPPLPAPVLRVAAAGMVRADGKDAEAAAAAAAAAAPAGAEAKDFDWRDLPDDVWLRVCGGLELESLSALLRTCKDFGEFGDIHRVFSRRELRCFHTKASLQDCLDIHTTLGICLATQRRCGASHSMDYVPTRWPLSPRIAVKCDP